MAKDERAKHLRRLRRLRRAARRWSVQAGLLGGAAAVLVPYQGIGLLDAAWAAAAGGSGVIAFWRWADLRAFSARPLPPPPSPELEAARANERLATMVRKVPGGHAAIEEFQRQRAMARLRGLAVAEPWRRLDRASMTLSGLRGRLVGPAASAVTEATAAERALRELAERAAGVERTMRIVDAATASPLQGAHQDLMGQLTEGVGAYERLVGAAAGYVAEDGRSAAPTFAVSRLTEATDLLRGISQGLSELRRTVP